MSRSNLEQPCIDEILPPKDVINGEYLPNLKQPLIELVSAYRTKYGLRDHVLYSYPVDFLPNPLEHKQFPLRNVSHLLRDSLIDLTSSIVETIKMDSNINVVACRYGKKYGTLPLQIITEEILVPNNIEIKGSLSQLPGERQKRIVRLGLPIKEISNSTTSRNYLGILSNIFQFKKTA